MKTIKIGYCLKAVTSMEVPDDTPIDTQFVNDLYEYEALIPADTDSDYDLEIFEVYDEKEGI